MAYLELNVATITSTRSASNANGLRIIEGFAKRTGLIAPDIDLATADAQVQQQVMDDVSLSIARHLRDVAKIWEASEAADAARQAALDSAADWA